MLRDAVASEDCAERPAAINYFCTHYWYPLYVFARLKGLNHEDAQDQTQIFLSGLIRRNSLQRVDADKGRLRSYLLSAFQNQLINHWEHHHAVRRGGGMTTVSLDMMGAEERFTSDAYDPAVQPEEQYDRAWALSLINACIDIMAAEHQGNGQAEAFMILRPFLNPSSVADACVAEAARQLGMSETAVRQRIFRLRAAFSKLLREHVAGSLAHPTPEAIEEEMRSLRHALEQF